MENTIKTLKVDDGKLEITVDTDRVDDVEILDLIDELNSNSAASSMRFAKFILGEEQFEKVKKYYKDNYGKMRIKHLSDVIETAASVLNPKD